MKRKRLTPEQRLGAIVAEFLRRAPNTYGDWERYRRALRALLRERETRVLRTLDEHHWRNTLESRNAVGDAVLGRRK